MLFINIRKVPREVLKTSSSPLVFSTSPRDLANVNEFKIMFDPSIIYSVNFRDSFSTMSQGEKIRSVSKLLEQLVDAVSKVLGIIHDCADYV